MFTLLYSQNRCEKRIWVACSSTLVRQLTKPLFYYMTYVGFGMGNTLESMSSWITVLISVERCISIKWPHLARLNFTRHKAKYQLGCLLLTALLFHVPIFLVLKVESRVRTVAKNVTNKYQFVVFTEFGNSSYYYTYTWARFILVQCIPLIILCVMSTMILLLIWSSYRKQNTYRQAQFTLSNQEGVHNSFKNISQHRINVDKLSRVEESASSLEVKHSTNECLTGEKCTILLPDSKKTRQYGRPQSSTQAQRIFRQQRANHKLTILLTVVIFLFLAGQIPQALAYKHIVNLFIPAACEICTVYTSLYRHFSQLSTLTTSTANFFVYLSLNRHFRVRLVALFHCKQCTKVG